MRKMFDKIDIKASTQAERSHTLILKRSDDLSGIKYIILRFAKQTHKDHVKCPKSVGKI